jgi:hypothetical protein
MRTESIPNGSLRNVTLKTLFLLRAVPVPRRTVVKGSSSIKALMWFFGVFNWCRP